MVQSAGHHRRHADARRVQRVGQSTPFITGVETASALWFFGITLLVSMFSHKFSPRIVTAMNRVCGAVVVLYGVKLLADFVMAVL